MKDLQENILNFEGADNLITELWNFNNTHKILELRVFPIHSEYYFEVIFTDVEYFSGLTTWTGANFKLHSAQECLEFIQVSAPKLWQSYQNLEKNGSPQILTDNLYSIPSQEGFIVQILASGVSAHLHESL